MSRISERAARLVVRLIAGLGATIFGLLLILTFLSQINYERAARGFLEDEIGRRLATVSTATSDSAVGRLTRIASSLAERNQVEAAVLRGQLRDGLMGVVASNVAHLQDPTCTCREQLRRFREAMTLSRIEMLDSAAPHLQRIIAGQYAAIVHDLLAELRIFLGINLTIFLALLILSFGSFAGKLLLPALLLAISTIAASAFYIFGQDWFFTILLGRYLGYGYGLWLLAVFALLSDIVLFKARFTGNILSAVPGSVPC